MLCDWLQKFTLLSQPIRSIKPKPFMTCLRAFGAWRRLCVFFEFWLVRCVVCVCYFGLCHAILAYFEKVNGVFASSEPPKWWSSFVIKDYITALKLFPVVCWCGWQGWKWIETWKNWAKFFKFLLCLQKSPKKLLWLTLPDKIHSISSTVLPGHFVYMGTDTK